MSVTRYFVNFAYMGTRFRGSQRQVKGGIPRPDDPSTVQGVMEMGLKYLNPAYDTIVCMASRTDAGVHALNTTCHFDFRRASEFILEPKIITIGLNSFFRKSEMPVRILNSKIVPDEFHSRHHSISRTYLYRMIIEQHEETKTATHFLPIEETDRVFSICTSNFSLDAMREAANLFEGVHDFRTFTGTTRDSDRITRRKIDSIKIVERRKDEVGVSWPYSWPATAFHNHNETSYTILDVYFKGKGFLYKQVRRTAGALLSAGTGQITLKEIRCMLEVPSKHSWNSRVKTLPGYGLYLCEIEY